MSLVQFTGRSGSRRRRCSVALATLFCLTVAASWASRGMRARAELPGRAVQGQSETVVVPMVSEPWSATLGRPNPSSATKQVHFIGHWPGFEALKREANRAVQRKLAPQQGTPLQQSLAPSAPAAPAVTVFGGPGESDTGIIPPDSQIAAGPTYLVVVVNSLLAIYDKTGVLQGSFQQLSSFFSSLGITGEIFDPRIIFDQTDSRFIFSAAEVDMTNFTNGHVLVAVSQTSDPRGLWNKYALDFKGRNTTNTADTFPDFPTLGLSSSAVYLSTGQFMLNSSCAQSGSCSFSDTWIEVIGLPGVLSGSTTLNITTFKDVLTAGGQLAFSIQPALTYGASGAEFLVASDFSANPGSTLNLFSVTTTGTPTLSTANLTVPAFALPPDAQQAGSVNLIVTDDFRLLNAVWSNGFLWCGQNVADSSGAHAVSRWYEIQASSLASASLVQSGDVNGSGNAYYPAISVKADGMVGMVFTTSSSFQPASAAFTARETTDPSGSMRSYAIYKAGSGAYDESVGNRWGDYSGISEDPDGGSLWMMAEYSGVPDPHFGTSIARMTAPPEISASPGALSFGSVLVGSVATAQTVTLTNIGSNTVALSLVTIAGVNANDFSLTADQCSNVSLGANQTCTLSVGFKPSVNAAEVAYLSIVYGGPGGLITVGLSGTGIIKAILNFSPPSLTFPDTVVGGASASQVATLTNSGNVVAQLYAVGVDGPGFTETSNCGSSLSAGASCQFTVTFRPFTSGVFQTGLSVSIVGQSANASLPLSGTGITAPAADLCPPSITFPAQVVNTTSNPQAVILTNNGSAQLTITGVTPSGDFSETTNCPGSLAARTSCVINVTFTPTSTGTRSGSITVSDNAKGSPQAVTLVGTGSTTAASLPKELPLVVSNGGPSVGGVLASSSRAAARQAGRQELTKHPLFFEPNVGQFDPAVAFGGRFPGYNLAVTRTGVALELTPRLPAKPTQGPAANRSGGRSEPHVPAVVTMRLVGANPDVRPAGLGKFPGRVNYFIGRDPRDWRTNVPTYGRVMLRGVYPGIDLTYYGDPRRLEYDFIVAPGADPRSVAFKINSSDPKPVKRAVKIAANGDLVIGTTGGEVRFLKPIVYQETETRDTGHGRSNNGQATGIARPSPIANRKVLDDRYTRLSDDRIGFEIAGYDRSKPLVIDPVLSFSTYLGGSGGDRANAIAVDSSGNAYIAGQTSSLDFPVTSNAFQKGCGTQQYPCSSPFVKDAFVAKLSVDGSTLLYATYLGGTNITVTAANAIAVDSSGNAYIAGVTESNDFPTTPGSFQPQPSAPLGNNFEGSGFVTKLNPTGSSLLYSTYLGGPPAVTSPFPPSDSANGIALDSAGEAYVVGTTSSSGFPTTSGAFQTAGPGPHDVIGFVTKFNAAGSGLVFSTFLGGTGNDQLTAVTVDASGNAYVAGMATSLDFATTPGVFQSGAFGTFSLGVRQGVIAKFTASGSIVYSTYLGSTNGNGINAIALDSSGASYVTGADSGGFPTTVGGSNQASAIGGVFVAKLHPAGCALPYANYLNFPFPSNSDIGSAIAVDSTGDIYVAGGFNVGISGSQIVTFPGVNALQPAMGVAPAFLEELDPSGLKVLFSTSLGGSGQFGGGDADEVLGMTLGPVGDIYVAGKTSSQDFPVANALEPVAPPLTLVRPTAFAARISPKLVSGVSLTRSSLTWAPLPIGYNGNAQIQAVGLQNNQSTPLNLSSAALSGNGFSLVTGLTNSPPACSGSIAPGTGCAVYVQLVPTTPGPITGTITITDDGPGSPRTVTLNGTGAADFQLGTDQTSSSVIAGQNKQYNIYAEPVYGSPSSTAAIALSCGGASAVTCSFAPSTIAVNASGYQNSAQLTVSNLNAVSGQTLHFSVVGTAGAQTYSVPVSLLIEDFSLSAAQASASVSPGQSASYRLTVAPVNGFNQSVSFGCSGAPSSATCTVSPSALALDGTHTANPTVTVTTTAPSLTLRVPPPFLPLAGHGLEDLPFWIVSLVMLATLLVVRRRVGPATRTAVLAASLLFVLLWAACGGGGGGGGGGNSGTPPGTYNLDVSATFTSGSTTLKHDIQLKLTVN